MIGFLLKCKQDLKTRCFAGFLGPKPFSIVVLKEIKFYVLMQALL
jgi:hypothetical protein